MHNSNQHTSRASEPSFSGKTPLYLDNLHVGRATDLSGGWRRIYRALEALPALLAWGTLIAVVLLSAYIPRIAAYLIILFALFWLLKTVYFSLHLRHNHKRLRYNLSLNWSEKLQEHEHEHIKHLVLLPFYTEPKETLKRSLDAIVQADGDPQSRYVVLAAEERAGESTKTMAEELAEEYAAHVGRIIVTVHPANVPGEMPGKGANISYAAEEARKRLLDEEGVAYENVLVSSFDVDTVVYPQYFQCLTWHFVTVDDPLHASFQPVPLFNNNIWDAPALARVVAVSATFWQMIQQERPEKLATFSSHAVPFKALWETGYWQPNMVSEDSRIYWNLFFAYNGNYRVVPISYPVSMDANFTRSFWKTIANIYRQQRRWTWGVENVPYVLYHSMRNAAIPLGKRIRASVVQLEGFWSLATHPLILFLLGWLPIILGDRAFHVTLLSHNLPMVARGTLTIAMLGLLISAVISLTLLPPRPVKKPLRTFGFMLLQWILVPVTMIVFSSIPGLESQTRLAIGRHLGFWVTPKQSNTDTDAR